MKDSRDEPGIRSHAQVWFVKQLKLRKELPAKVRESGNGYTLSGKALNKYSSIALKVFSKPEDVPLDMGEGTVESDEEAAKKLKRPKNKTKGAANDTKTKEKTNSNGKNKNKKVGKKFSFFSLFCFSVCYPICLYYLKKK